MALHITDTHQAVNIHVHPRQELMISVYFIVMKQMVIGIKHLIVARLGNVDLSVNRLNVQKWPQ